MGVGDALHWRDQTKESLEGELEFNGGFKWELKRDELGGKEERRDAGERWMPCLPSPLPHLVLLIPIPSRPLSFTDKTQEVGEGVIISAIIKSPRIISAPTHSTPSHSVNHPYKQQ